MTIFLSRETASKILNMETGKFGTYGGREYLTYESDGLSHFVTTIGGKEVTYSQKHKMSVYQFGTNKIDMANKKERK